MSDVIEFRTKQQRAQAEDAEQAERVHAGAIALLERAIQILNEERAAGRRCTGTAVAFTLDDGAYGRLRPDESLGADRLIGAVATLQHDLILQTRVPAEDA